MLGRPCGLSEIRTILIIIALQSESYVDQSVPNFPVFWTLHKGVLCHFLCTLCGAKEYPIIICYDPVIKQGPHHVNLT